VEHAGDDDDRGEPAQQRRAGLVGGDHARPVRPAPAPAAAGERRDHRDEEEVREAREQRAADHARRRAVIGRQRGEEDALERREQEEHRPQPRSAHPPAQPGPPEALDPVGVRHRRRVIFARHGGTHR
jgi:hypothetical protein